MIRGKAALERQEGDPLPFSGPCVGHDSEIGHLNDGKSVRFEFFIQITFTRLKDGVAQIVMTKLMREGDERRSLLAETVNALKQLEKTHGATVAELNVLRESRAARDEELRANAMRAAADAEARQNAVVSELRQKLVSCESKLAQSEFAREQVQTTLL